MMMVAVLAEELVAVMAVVVPDSRMLMTMPVNWRKYSSVALNGRESSNVPSVLTRKKKNVRPKKNANDWQRNARRTR